MKIQKTKSSVTASEELIATPYEPSNKEIAVEHIQSAIDALSAQVIDTPDPIATDSIANLGVVLLDLKSSM